MASTMLGRAACPECGFPHAHVKQKIGEATRAYRFCPDCGSQYYARSQGQHDALVAKMTPIAAAIAELAAQAAAAPAPADPPPAADLPPEPKGYKMVLGVKVPL